MTEQTTYTAPKFTKVAKGWYATDTGSESGEYMVVVDGFDPVQSVAASGDYEGFQGGEWCAVVGGSREDHQSGETFDWFPTKRQAVEWCERHARQAAARAAAAQ